MTTTLLACYTPLAAISLDSIPPDAWTAIVTAALTLAVSAAHARGRKLPFIEWVLDAILATKPKPVAGEPPTVLNEVLAELKALRAGREAPGGAK